MQEELKDRPQVRVLESVPGPATIVKYIDSIVRYAPDDIGFFYFSWFTALFGRYDVFHVHWPEFLVRDRSRLKAWVRRVLFRLLLLRLRLQGVPVIRTVHNIEPHRAGGASESNLLDRLDGMVSRYVALSSCTADALQAETVVIPHGDFIEVFEGIPRAERVGKRVLLFGRIEPYKGVMDLLRAAREITSAAVEVRIVGATRQEMRDEIEEQLQIHPGDSARVSLDLRSVSDHEMVREMTEADLIALPYRDAGNGNSGVAMVALSLNRPVLVYRNCIMERLSDETGSGWVQMMDQPITGEQIEAALERVSQLDPNAEPHFEGRDWPSISSAYADVFRSVVKEK